MRAVFGAIHRGIARSPLAMRIVVKILRQCRAIVCAHLNDGRDPERNGEYRLLSLVAPEAHVFIDVGANVGYWACHFARLMKQPEFGILLEPAPDALAALRMNVATLGLRTVVIAAAAGDRAGEMTFFAEAGAGETSSLVPGFSAPNAQAITVRVTTIDQEVLSRGIGHIDFLKVDAEGFDLRVLRGAEKCLRDRMVDFVQFEYNSPWARAGATLADAIGMLTECGYEVFLLKANGLRKINYDLYGEYFGYSNYVAVAPGQISKVLPITEGRIFP